MVNKLKTKTITFRLTSEEYAKCLNLMSEKSKYENKIIKLSEIIREAILKL